MDFTSEQATLADQGVATIQPILEQQVLGKFHKGWKCNCGAVHGNEATAVRIIAPDNHYGPEQKVLWYLWEVNMREVAHPDQDYHWSTGLSVFLSQDALERLFTEHFGDLIAVARAR